MFTRKVGRRILASSNEMKEAAKTEGIVSGLKVGESGENAGKN